MLLVMAWVMGTNSKENVGLCYIAWCNSGWVGILNKSPECRGRHFGVVVDLIDMASVSTVAAKLGNNWPASKRAAAIGLLQKKHTKHQTPSAFYPSLSPFPSPFMKVAPTQHKLYSYFNIIADATREKQARIFISPRDDDGMAFNGTDSTHHHKLWRDVRGQGR